MSLPIVLDGDAGSVADFEKDSGGDCESDDGSDMVVAHFNAPCMQYRCPYRSYLVVMVVVIARVMMVMMVVTWLLLTLTHRACNIDVPTDRTWW